MPAEMSLRPYQKEAVDAIEAEWRKGTKRTLLVLPTGTGKTIVFCTIAKDCVMSGDRVLILAHRGISIHAFRRECDSKNIQHFIVVVFIYM